MKAMASGRFKHALSGFSIEHVWCLTTLAGIFVFLSTHPIRPQDFWWHIKAGQEIAATGHIPSVDSFSFTVPGQAYPSYQIYWLMELTLYSVYAFGGGALVVFFHSLIVTTAYGLVLWLCHWLSSSWRVAALCTLFAAALGLNDWNVRPQAVTFLLGAVLLWVVYYGRGVNTAGARRSLRPWWLVPVFGSMVVWVNSHGSFPIGLAVLAMWLADEVWQILKARLGGEGWGRVRRLLQPAMALAVALLACLFNPRGADVIIYLDTMGGSSVVQNLVPEWTPPSFDSLHGGLFLVALLLSAAVLALSSRRPSLFQMVTFLSFAILGLRTLRGVIWFGIVMAPILAVHLPTVAEQARLMIQRPIGQRPADSKVVLNYVFAGLVLVGVLISLPWFKGGLGLPEEKTGVISSETPVEATRFLLQEGLPGPLFHHISFGSYLTWAAQPAYPVFVDPRIELYPPEIWRDYMEISAGPCDWEARLDGYGINTLMLNPRAQRSLIEAAGESPHWRLVYEDASAVLFTRESWR